MRTLAAGSWIEIARSRSRPGGFTLIELLVVMVIMAAVATVAVLSMPANRGASSVEDEMDRLQALVTMAIDQAVLRGRQVGMVAAADGYRFVEFTAGRWQPLTDNLRPRRLPASMSLYLAVEDQSLIRETADGFAGEAPHAPGDDPQVLFLSSGEMTPFEVVLAEPDGGANVRLRVGPDLGWHRHSSGGASAAGSLWSWVVQP
jgi:general secretion pathway protein H